VGYPQVDAAGYADVTLNTSAALTCGNVTAGGFTLVNSANPQTFAAIALATPFFTEANPSVWTTATAHGYSVGDVVRVYGLTGAAQFSGLAATVTAVTSTTFTTLINTTGVTPPTAGFVQKIGTSPLYVPTRIGIAGITQANPMVVTTLVQANYQVGQQVVFDIPQPFPATPAFGMNQLSVFVNSSPFVATITAVNNAIGTQTLTFGNVDSTNFTAFTWPTNAQAVSQDFGFPFVVPNSDGQPNPLPFPNNANQNVVVGATRNAGLLGILIGTGIIGTTTDVWEWTAYQANQTFYNQ
jgi:hypothetical protein